MKNDVRGEEWLALMERDLCFWYGCDLSDAFGRYMSSEGKLGVRSRCASFCHQAKELRYGPAESLAMVPEAGAVDLASIKPVTHGISEGL